MTAAAAFVAMILVFSIDAKIDPGDDLLTTRGYETYADLTNDDVSTKPSGWTGREETAEAEIAQVKGANLEGRDLRNAYATGAFLAKAKLASGDLTGAELIGANLTGADLSGADLSGGKLTGADVSDALGVTQAELDEACGDEHTQLPQGLATSMCPVTAPQPSR